MRPVRKTGTGKFPAMANLRFYTALLVVLASLPPAHGAANRQKPGSSTSPSPSQPSAASPVLFSTDWAGKTKMSLPAGVTLVAGKAHPATVDGKRFLQVTDSASLDLQLSGPLPEAYTIEFEMQVPASTGYAVEIRPEAAASPAGAASVSRRMQHPVALCGAISSGLYAASDAQSQLKRYPDADAKQLRLCKVEADGNTLRVSYAGQEAASAIGASLGTGGFLRLHVPASAQAPALIGPVTVSAAAGSSVNAAQQGKPYLDVRRAFLELDTAGGVVRDGVRSIEGGEPVADMVEQPGPNGVDIHPGPIHYADVVAGVPLNSFAKVLGAWAAGQQGPLDGRVIGADFDYKHGYQRSLKQARLAEVAFPALDGSSKESGYLELRLAPASTELTPLPGNYYGSNMGAKQKAWLLSNFRLDIPGLATKKVSRIEPFKLSLKTSGGTSYVGGTRLTVTFAASDAATWLDWQDQLLKGQPSERTLDLAVLGPDLKKPLVTLKGTGVGLLSLAPLAYVANSEKLPRLRAELYVERWQIVPGAASE